MLVRYCDQTKAAIRDKARGSPFQHRAAKSARQRQAETAAPDHNIAWVGQFGLLASGNMTRTVARIERQADALAGRLTGGRRIAVENYDPDTQAGNGKSPTGCRQRD